jgi:predicted alpha-1,2-mannosidase
MKLISLITYFIFSTILYAQNISIDAVRDAQNKRPLELVPKDPTNNSRSKILYVNPFIGTGGHGHTYPGASAPFGMMQLSPDTRHDGWDGCAGYHYSDSIIYGFSHTHLSGTGVPDYCDVLLVPQSGNSKTTPGYLDKNGYGSRFSHKSEKASPGYYEVFLEDPKINVRLTASTRAGMHEYNFVSPNEKRFILIDLDHRDKVIKAATRQISTNQVQGYRISNAWATEQHIYFHMETSVPIMNYTLIETDNQHKALLEFADTVQKVTIKIGISAVDQQGAYTNLTEEINHWDFNKVLAETTKNWNNELGKITIETNNKTTLINFYTALYHSFLSPNIFSDRDGRYRGRDHQIYQLTDKELQYSVFSLWDTYRATHPLFTVVQQKRTTDFLETFLRQYNEGGDLPVWELAANETECMIGYHSVSVISDAFTKGIVDIDSTKFLDAMVKTSNFNEYAKQSFAKNGFIASSEEPESVSKTLEYAYDDFCIAQFAKKAGKQAIHDEYLKRSMNFINSFDPSTSFMRARRNGQWFSPFDPTEVNFNYTEANSWQYSLYAPHAVGVLTQLLGGKDSLENWLDNLFSTKSELSGRHQVDITGLIGQYAHGNEPSHHMAYLYNYTNSSFKTQATVDRILNEMYTPQPDGLSGNEDCGQMSSWYVLSALGIYQIAPSSPIFDIGRPLIDKALIKLENGKTLTFNTLNNSKENKYVQSVWINNQEIFRNYLTFEELNAGGTIEFRMGNSPSLSKDNFVSTPTLESVPSAFVPCPYFEQTEATFDSEFTVSLNFPKRYDKSHTHEIQYSYDSVKWIAYKKPIRLDRTTTLFARVKKNSSSSTYYSPVISNQFTKRDKSISIELNSIYANQYAAGGQTTLIDGIRGGKEFRTGDWQGYWAQDLNALVKFEQGKKVSEIGLSCIQDTKSWIFFPSELIIEVSKDGSLFESIGKIDINTLNQSFSSPSTSEFTIKLDQPIEVKKIRISAKNFGKCPEWHLGSGNDTWLFVDEIIFR